MTAELAPNRMKVVALYYTGRNPVLAVDLSKTSEAVESQKDILLLPPTPESLLPEDKICVVLGHFLPSTIALENTEIAFTRSRVRFSNLKRFENRVLSGYEADVRVPGVLKISVEYSIERKIPCGILTVSDKGSRGERTDSSGPALIAKCAREGFCVVRYDIVPDDASTIQATLRRWIREGVLLILTSGGTGLSHRDVTPDVMRAFSDFEIPGIGEAMRLHSMNFTPMAVLSRCGGFVSEDSILLSLPGSERGAVQSFDAVRSALKHAVEIRNGWSGDCASTHHHFHREKQHGK